MRGHAGTEIECDAVEVIAAAGGAIRSALPKAVDLRIAIVPAARALGEVAAERGEMTNLRSCQSLRGSAKARIGRSDAGVGRDRGDGGEGPDARSPVRAPVDPDGVGRGGDIDQRAAGEPAAPPFGKVGTGGAEFRGLGGGGDGCGTHAATLPFSAATRRSGRIGISASRMPVAWRMALATAGEVATVATSPIPTLPPSTWS